jgi:hypothetical protein
MNFAVALFGIVFESSTASVFRQTLRLTLFRGQPCKVYGVAITPIACPASTFAEQCELILFPAALNHRDCKDQRETYDAPRVRHFSPSTLLLAFVELELGTGPARYVANQLE